MTDPAAARLAIVIVNYNTAGYLERCLASLDAVAREPPQRGALESIRLGLANSETHREGVAERRAAALPASTRICSVDHSASLRSEAARMARSNMG